MQNPAVVRQFQEQIDHYVREKQATDSLLIPYVIDWLRKKNFKKKIKICEFGGGAGQLLGLLQEHYPKASYTDAEILPQYRNYLVSKNISFSLRSLLHSKFANQSFDVLIIRDVLHHLVGRDYQETVQNQLRGLEELRRLVRPGGAIFIEEITNRSEIITKVLFYLTRANIVFGMRVPILSISPNTHIAFFTPARLKSLIKEVFAKSYQCFFTIYPVPTGFASRLTHFLQPIEKVVVIIKAIK